jgi:predicted nucleotidyltransferase
MDRVGERNRRIVMAKVAYAQAALLDIRSAAVVGSTARGWFDEKSDIDILVIVENREIALPVNQYPFNFSAIELSTVNRLLGITQHDLVGLRTIATLATAVAIAGDHEIYEAAKAHNKNCDLRAEIKEFYFSVRVRSNTSGAL